ncbi:MAG: hypothetical protein ACR2JH_01635 [Solirubrobacteraceae bacterium]
MTMPVVTTICAGRRSAAHLACRCRAGRQAGSTCAPEADAGQPDVTIVGVQGARPGRIRYLFVAELSQLFMRAQARGWLAAGSRLMATAMGYPWRDFSERRRSRQRSGRARARPSARQRLDGRPREDYLNRPGVGEAADGCRVLFLYYLVMQLKFSVEQVVGAAAVDQTHRRTRL